MTKRRLQLIVRKKRSKVRKKRRLRMKKKLMKIRNLRGARVNKMKGLHGRSSFLIRITTPSQKDS